jgi:hypothetical protein
MAPQPLLLPRTSKNELSGQFRQTPIYKSYCSVFKPCNQQQLLQQGLNQGRQHTQEQASC